jgi:hypothetical protein
MTVYGNQSLIINKNKYLLHNLAIIFKQKLLQQIFYK